MIELSVKFDGHSVIKVTYSNCYDYKLIQLRRADTVENWTWSLPEIISVNQVKVAAAAFLALSESTTNSSSQDSEFDAHLQLPFFPVHIYVYKMCP